MKAGAEPASGGAEGHRLVGRTNDHGKRCFHRRFLRLEVSNPLFGLWWTRTDLLKGLCFSTVPIDHVTRLTSVERARVDVAVDKGHRIPTPLAFQGFFKKLGHNIPHPVLCK